MSDQYTSLNDAAENLAVDRATRAALQPGKTEVWYMNRRGWDAYPMGPRLAHEPLPLAGKVKASGTHELLGTVASRDPDQLFGALQGESWSPRGEARELIQRLGLRHTSMSVGDILVFGAGNAVMVDGIGFRKLPRTPREQDEMRAEDEAERRRLRAKSGHTEDRSMRATLRALEESAARRC